MEKNQESGTNGVAQCVINHEQEVPNNDGTQTAPPKGGLTDKLWFDEKHSFPIPEKVMESVKSYADIIGPQLPRSVHAVIFPPAYYYRDQGAAFETMLEETVSWALQDIVGALRDVLMNFSGPEKVQFRTIQAALEREILRLDAIKTWAEKTARYDPVVIRNVLAALEEYPELDPNWTEDKEECEEAEPGNGKAEMAGQADDRPYASDIELSMEIWSHRHKGLLKALGMVIWDIQQTPLDKQPDLSALSPLHEAIEKHMDELDTSIKDCGRCRLRKRGRVDAGVAIQEQEPEEQPTVQ